MLTCQLIILHFGINVGHTSPCPPSETAGVPVGNYCTLVSTLAIHHPVRPLLQTCHLVYISLLYINVWPYVTLPLFSLQLHETSYECSWTLWPDTLAFAIFVDKLYWLPVGIVQGINTSLHVLKPDINVDSEDRLFSCQHEVSIFQKSKTVLSFCLKIDNSFENWPLAVMY